MSFLITATKEEIKIEYNERLIPSPVLINETKNYVNILLGEVFSEDDEKILLGDWSKDDFFSIVGNISAIRIDKETKKVFFAVDYYALEKLYYYYNSNENFFMLSDNFWEITANLNIRFNDLNIEFIKEKIVMDPILGGTYINNLDIVKSASYGEFDVGRNKLQLYKHNKSFFDNKKNITLGEAVEELYKAIDLTVKQAKDKIGDNAIIAAPISGGLDSRLIPYFLIKNNIDAIYFILGKKRPNHLLLSQDYKNARKIAKYYGVKLNEIPYDNKHVIDRWYKDIISSPFFEAQFNKSSIFPFQFDTLITGASGGAVDADDICDNIIYDIKKCKKQILRFIYKPMFKDKVKRAISYLFNLNISSSYTKIPDWYRKVFSEETENKIEKKLKELILEEKKITSSDFAIYRNIDMYIASFNRYGAFESIMGEKRSFSIYYPYAWLCSRNWGEIQLNERNTLKDLIEKIDTELITISEQSYKTISNNKIKKILKLGEFILRGNGTADKSLYRCRTTQKEMKKIYNSDCRWFWHIFPDLNRKDITKIRKNYFMVTKVKSIIDAFESKQYIEWGEKKYNWTIVIK